MPRKIDHVSRDALVELRECLSRFGNELRHCVGSERDLDPVTFGNDEKQIAANLNSGGGGSEITLLHPEVILRKATRQYVDRNLAKVNNLSTTDSSPPATMGAEVDAPRSAPSLTLQGNRAQLQQFLDSYVRVTGHEPPPDEIADFMTRRMIPE